MRNLTNRLLIFTTAFLFAAQASAFVELDANIDGVFTDASFATLVPGSSVDPDGNNATVTLAAGQGIQISVDIANLNGDTIASIFSTITFQGDQLLFLGGAAIPEVLLGGPVFAPTSLGRVAQPAIKINTPTPNTGATAGDVWVQSTAFASTGTDGTGPDLAAVVLFFQVTGAVGADQIDFILGETAGDSISGTPTFSGATINVPEPGSWALGLASLGTLGLITRVRRRA